MTDAQPSLPPSEPAVELAAKPVLHKRVGARIKDYYMTMGAFDFVVVFEAPDDEAIVKFLLSVGSWGALRYEILRAFTRPEYNRIMRGYAALNRAEAAAMRKTARRRARSRRCSKRWARGR